MIRQILSSSLKSQFNRQTSGFCTQVNQEMLKVEKLFNENLKITVELENRKSIYILDKESSFKEFEQKMKLDYPFQNIKFNLNSLDENQTVQQFLNDKMQLNQVEIETDNKCLILQNLNQNEIFKNINISLKENEFMRELLESLGENKNTSNGPLIYLIHNIKHKLKSQESSITIDQLQQIYIECLQKHSFNYKENIVQIQEEIRNTEEQISELESEKEEIEGIAQKKIILYLKLLVLVSIAQILIFYYSVFHVEWLGWDIMEPLTYSVASISIVLMIRYFLKYKRNRDWHNIRDIYVQRVIDNNKLLRERFQLIEQQLQTQNDKKTQLDVQLWLQMNKITNDYAIE